MLRWNLPNLITIGLMGGVWYAFIVALLSLVATPSTDG